MCIYTHACMHMSAVGTSDFFAELRVKGSWLYFCLHLCKYEFFYGMWLYSCMHMAAMKHSTRRMKSCKVPSSVFSPYIVYAYLYTLYIHTCIYTHYYIDIDYIYIHVTIHTCNVPMALPDFFLLCIHVRIHTICTYMDTREVYLTCFVYVYTLCIHISMHDNVFPDCFLHNIHVCTYIPAFLRTFIHKYFQSMSHLLSIGTYTRAHILTHTCTHKDLPEFPRAHFVIKTSSACRIYPIYSCINTHKHIHIHTHLPDFLRTCLHKYIQRTPHIFRVCERKLHR
jgi:hypothetical protein